MSEKKTIHVGNVKIQGDIILSPMAGFSDSPYRQITREFGSAFSFTEFVSTDGISRGSKKSIDLFRFQESERPIFFQIFGNKLDVITEAAKIIEDLNPDVIDLNMGCSVTKVAHKGSGAGLLKNPAYAGKIIESLSKNVKLPITAKIRLGWDHKSLNYKEVVTALEESGVKAISVHGRTKSMGYTGKADWNAIAEIKSFAKVPIFGNGDIQTYKEAKDRINETGVDAVLIGRAAIGNPWIFKGIEKSNLKFSEIREGIYRHLKLMLGFYGERQGLILFRKHVSKYLRGFFGIADLRDKLVTVTDLKDFYILLNEYDTDIVEPQKNFTNTKEVACTFS
ncbi:MAG: tRNA dihydrouridine synthase DusB [Leptospiraceae bacterium]|nr:tRNA dihydrouridine synthase DusB [Leptospiraceae bacterium]MCK6379936.1 tRNA dihydrouridine synthase DusB [Leptospiraceae bacterium]